MWLESQVDVLWVLLYLSMYIQATDGVHTAFGSGDVGLQASQTDETLGHYMSPSGVQ